MELKGIISLVIDYWKENSIKIIPNSIDKIEFIQKDNNLQMPSDFKYFYSRINGMGELYPNESDKEGFLFYPIEEIMSVEKYFAGSNLVSKQNVFIFSDYMQKSWWYGFEVMEDDSYRIGIIPNKDIFVPITNHLGDFLDLYLKDSSELYEY